MSPGTTIALALLTPVVGACGVALCGRWPNVRETVTIVAGAITLFFVVNLAGMVTGGERPVLDLVDVLPGLTLGFKVEPLGMVYALVAGGLWPVTSFYAFGYMRGHHEKNQTRFFICFALAIFAALGIAFSRNLFTLFVFYEVLTFSTYPLVTHHGNEEAKRAGRKYLGILVSTSVAFLLLAVIWTWQISGTVEFTPGGILEGKAEGWVVPVLLGLFAFGTGKAALMPFHKWLPAAMVAPTPVSALLHAVAVVKAGVFTVLKISVYIFGTDFLTTTGASVWLMYAAGFTMICASVIALTKDNLKARLAYSTISQLAYIVLAAALATPQAAIGGGMHIAMHAMGKITLFFCAGAIMVATHKKKISEMDGIGRTMPFTMIAFLVGSLSIIGLPPLGGSWSKWYLALGAADSGHLVFVAAFMVSSLLSIGYLMPVVGRAFFVPVKPVEHADDDHHAPADGIHEAPLLCVVPLCVTALGCVVMFFFAEHVYDLLLPIAGGG